MLLGQHVPTKPKNFLVHTLFDWPSIDSVETELLCILHVLRSFSRTYAEAKIWQDGHL